MKGRILSQVFYMVFVIIALVKFTAASNLVESIQGRLSYTLSQNKDILPRVAAGIRLEGNCTEGECELDVGREAQGLPPLYTFHSMCKLKLFFKNNKLSQMTLKVEGIGRECSIARRDAELRAVSVVVRFVEDVALTISGNMAIEDFKKIVHSLDKSIIALEEGTKPLQEAVNTLFERVKETAEKLEEEER